MIVVYCSLGVRSEDIAEQLKKEGYTNVYNLFGGIFEWKNSNHKVYDNKEEPTENVHAFSKKWSKWLLKGNKIYD
jgi:3-mercaptopyruvate sulfurtransferase SseA